ncbi:MAG: hypothetical protein EBY26_00295 [Microbacteriaceae bacterium]|nr:hypothetical protein [Microbacteriaceae bacterium]
MNCVNCGLDADWKFSQTGTEPVLYCETCLPGLLRHYIVEGSENITPVVVAAPVVEDAKSAKKRAADAPVDAATVAPTE